MTKVQIKLKISLKLIYIVFIGILRGKRITILLKEKFTINLLSRLFKLIFFI